MLIKKIPLAGKTPNSFNVIVEVPAESLCPVKYELDKDSGALFVDRFIATSMRYPCNYGFVPNTLSDDGDPIDVLVITEYPLLAGAVIPSKPIGVLIMEDEKGGDEKIIAVPTEKMNSEYSTLDEIAQVPEILLNKIKHFFEHYKDLEKGKWVKVSGFKNSTEAKKKIQEAIERSKLPQEEN
ncbi:MAG: inorganic diphosphatase [Rickettsiales bacterium]|jgi:inorganic pyrophosphatase|nr:inorganic diphosphatase [Rickettsiales bacterium]